MGQIDSFTERISGVIEARRVLLLVFFCILYLAIVFSLTSRRVFWNDELFTLHFSQLNSWQDLWHALSTGADQIPPTFILITKLFTSVLGANHISLRLPETIGFLVMLLCLYRIVSSRTSALYGFIAMCFPLVTAAFSYSYEARPYGLLLGFSGLAFLSWQLVAERTNRKAWLACLSVSLAGSWMSHYYGLLVLVPLVLGEVARSGSIRRIDVPVWVAFILSMIPILFFLPLLQGSLSYVSTFWGKTSWDQIFVFYNILFESSAIPFAFICLVSPFLIGSRPIAETVSIRSFRAYELVAAAGFAAMPIIAVVITKIFVGAFSERYAISAVLGFSILVSFAMYQFALPKSIVILSLLCLLVGFSVKSILDFEKWDQERESMKQQFQFLSARADKNTPIVFAQSILRLHYYGPKELASRVYYLADPKESTRYLGHDTMDRGFLDLRPWFPLRNVQPYDLFIKANSRFYIYHLNWQEEWKWTWIFYTLLADHKRIEMIAREGDQFLFLVTTLDQK